MERAEAIREWTFRSNHIKKWLDEYGEEPSIRHYVELIDMAIEALQDKEDEPQFYTEDDYWNGMFAESAEAYKAWTGEEMGVYVKSVKYPRDCNECWLAFPNNDWDFTSHCRALGEDCPTDGKLQKCPLVDRPHGEWKPSYGSKYEMPYKCSVCGCPSESNNHRYCPQCGAYMFSQFNTDDGGAYMRGGTE